MPRTFARTDAVQVGVEVKVLQDAQILVQSELLRHVADAVLDGLRPVEKQNFWFVQKRCRHGEPLFGSESETRNGGNGSHRYFSSRQRTDRLPALPRDLYR